MKKRRATESAIRLGAFNAVWAISVLDPIDYGWAMMDDAAKSGVILQQLLAAGHPEWEGDFRIGPKVLAWPNGDNTMDIGFVWKQDNNGTCFMAERIGGADRLADGAYLRHPPTVGSSPWYVRVYEPEGWDD